MCLASLPFWIILSVSGAYFVPLPVSSELMQILVVVVTTLFFMGTDRSESNQSLLASVEASQSGVVLFTIMGDILILGGSIPDLRSIMGLVLVLSGMILHSLVNIGE